MNIAFVILNYNTKMESSKSIRSIVQINGAYQENIVLVDNASKERIDDLKRDFPNVHYICSEYNVGFAKGNNLGYFYAKHYLNAEFVVVLNSDVIIDQKNFLSIIDKIYRDRHFFILGPDIVNLQGTHQNPASRVLKSRREVQIGIIINCLRYMKNSFFMMNNNKKKRSEKNWKNDDINVPIHGACVIFSPLFLEMHEHAFYPETFLFGEEEFLYFNAIQNNETIIYSTQIEVIHIEDASTDKTYVNLKEKKKFVLSNSIYSLHLLNKYMKEKGAFRAKTRNNDDF